MIARLRHAVAVGLGQRASGQALVYLTIMLLVLIGFAALATDTAQVWVNRRFLQNSADAAALAGAQDLMDPSGDIEIARAVACDYATVKNAVSGMTVDCSPQAPAVSEPCSANPNVDILVCQTYVPGDSIRVTTRKTINPIFGAALGWLDIDIRADAIAVVGSLRTLCVFPLFQTQNLLEASGVWEPDGTGNFVEYNIPTIMKTSANDNASGNFLALRVGDNNGWAAWRAMVGSPEGCLGQTSDTAETQTGNGEGPANQGLYARSLLWNDPAQPGYCPDTFPTFNADGVAVHAAGHPLAGEPLTKENCYRLVQFPLLEGDSEDFTGNEIRPIRGFLTFYISNWCGQNSNPKKGSGSDSQHCAAPSGTTLPELRWGELWGYYIEYEAYSPQPIQPYDGLGTQVVLLID